MDIRSTRWGIVLFALCAIAAGTPPTAGAQGTTASIQGVVTDDTGPLPGASIAARDTQSGFAYDTVSDAQGGFSLGGLRPGTYEITVAMNQLGGDVGRDLRGPRLDQPRRTDDLH